MITNLLLCPPSSDGYRQRQKWCEPWEDEVACSGGPIDTVMAPPDGRVTLTGLMSTQLARGVANSALMLVCFPLSVTSSFLSSSCWLTSQHL